MGGMTCLEWPLNSPPGFVKTIVPLATSARHSAWCISWGEAQRQSIYSDPDYKDGYYFEKDNGEFDLLQQPSRGLAAARMAALLTYRSRDSFESRFGRRSNSAANSSKSKVPKGGVRIMGGEKTTNPFSPSDSDVLHSTQDRMQSLREIAWREHNDGHRSSTATATSSRRNSESGRSSNPDSTKSSNLQTPDVEKKIILGENDKIGQGVALGSAAALGNQQQQQQDSKSGASGDRKIFSAQSYLRYQGDKVSMNTRTDY